MGGNVPFEAQSNEIDDVDVDADEESSGAFVPTNMQQFQYDIKGE